MANVRNGVPTNAHRRGSIFDFGGSSMASSRSGPSIYGGDNSILSGSHNDGRQLQMMMKQFSVFDEDDNDFIGFSRKSAQVPQKENDNSGRRRGYRKRRANILNEIRTAILSRVFKFNHVILTHQGVTVFLYHIVMLFEYIQLLFFIFYKVDIVNEFSLTKTEQESDSAASFGLTSTYSNSSTTKNGTGINASNLSAQYDYNALLNMDEASLNSTSLQTAALQQQQDIYQSAKIRIDQLFSFFNFQVYVLSSGSNEATFLYFYAIISGLFVIFLASIFFTANKLYEASKKDEIKESTKFVLGILSILMSLFMFLLEIPFTTALLQGYLCEEDPSLEYGNSELLCNGILHQILIVFSTISLIIYVGFLCFQHFLFTSSDFDSPLPWASYEKQLSITRCFYKLLLTGGFVFDKAGSKREIICLTCFLICAFIVYKRYRGAIIFNQSVQITTIAYEILAMWLFLTISIHTLAKKEILITDLCLMAACSLFNTMIFQFYQDKHRKNLLGLETLKYIKNPQEFHNYFFHLYRLLESGKVEDMIMLQGILANHIYNCESKDGCQCLEISESLESLKKLKRLKENQASQMRNVEGDMNDYEGAAQSEYGIKVEALHKQTIMGSPMPVDNVTDEIIVPVNFKKNQADRQNYLTNMLNKLEAQPSAPIQRQRSVNFQATAVTHNSSLRSAYNNSDSFNGTTNLNKKTTMSEQQIELLRFFEDQELLKRNWTPKLIKRLYQFVGQLVNDTIKKFPKDIELKFISAFIYKHKLKNEFKAIFDLMQCEQCKPTIVDQFIIFRRKLDIEKLLVRQQQKKKTQLGTIDVYHVYNYEKNFTKYQMHEYLTVNATLGFWQELLNKAINADLLRSRGQEIAANYQELQQIAEEVLQLYPEEIKFLFRYGMFLMNIINNEFDALNLFIRAKMIFLSKIGSRANFNMTNEITTFGENTASAIVILSANVKKVGTVMHCNEEVENLLGYTRKELIGKNVTEIIPPALGKGHDFLINRYFETAKPHVIEIKRRSFALGKDGYMKTVELLVKIYPYLNRNILFVGFIQMSPKFDEMNPVKMDYERMDQHYIMTDMDGYISNISEGLKYEIGLYSKFFNYGDSIFQSKVSISKICNKLMDQDIQDGLQGEGIAGLVFDTRNILSSVEIEKLESEDLIRARAIMGEYLTYVQLKQFVIDSRYCSFCIYRVILLGKVNIAHIGEFLNNKLLNIQLEKNATLLQKQLKDPNLATKGQANETRNQSMADSMLEGLHQQANLEQEPGTFQMNSIGQFASMGSMGSMSIQSGTSTELSMPFLKAIKDFKKSLGEKKTPKTVIRFNRVITLVLCITITLQSIDFTKLQSEVLSLGKENEHNLQTLRRTIDQVILAINARSLFNVANDIEFDFYDITQLQSVTNRFDYLQSLIQQEGLALHEVHEFLSGLRTDTSTSSNSIQSQFEYEKIELFQMDDTFTIGTYKQPFRQGLISYLNYIQMLNKTMAAKMILPDSLIYKSPLVSLTSKDDSLQLQGMSTSIQKAVYYIIANGLRSLRVRTLETMSFQQTYALDNMSQTPFLIVMIVAIISTVISVCVIYYMILKVEMLQQEIIILYSHLSHDEILDIFSKCNFYIEALNEGSIINKMLEPEPGEEEGEDIGLNSGLHTSLGLVSKAGEHESNPQIGGGIKKSAFASRSHSAMKNKSKSGLSLGQISQKSALDQFSIQSEEIKEELYAQKIMKQRYNQASASASNWNNRDNGDFFAQQKSYNPVEFYEQMIKCSQQQVRMMQEQEDVATKLNKTQKRKRRQTMVHAKAPPQVQQNYLEVGDGKSKFMKKGHIKGKSKKEEFEMAFKTGKKSRGRKSKRIQKQFFNMSGTGVPMKFAIEELDDMTTGKKSSEEKTPQRMSQQSSEEEEEEDVNEDRSSKSSADDHSTSFANNSSYNLNRTSRTTSIQPEQAQIDEMEQRQNMFKQSIKPRHWTLKIGIMVISLVFLFYFLQMFFYHNSIKDQVIHLQDNIPFFFDRYRYLLLAYGLMRERILFNSSLSSFQDEDNEYESLLNKKYGKNIDLLYHDLSLENEKTISKLKIARESILSDLLDLTLNTDSDQFCPGVIRNTLQMDTYTALPNVKASSSQIKTYQSLIDTIYRACTASLKGDIEILKRLSSIGIDLSIGDYDKTTPLHLAVRMNNMQITEYLVTQAKVNVNSLDRWEATPLNYAKDLPEIKQFLIQNGGQLGKPRLQLKTQQKEMNVLTDNDVRLFYAAKFGDMTTVLQLHNLGWHVNEKDYDGRTPLHVAAAEGHLDVVKFLIAEGADLTAEDDRGSNPIGDAEAENKMLVHNYLESIYSDSIIILNCQNFAEGLFKHGISQAIGSFHKKFSDLQIRIDTTTKNSTSYNQTVTQMLVGKRFAPVSQSPAAAAANNSQLPKNSSSLQGNSTNSTKSNKASSSKGGVQNNTTANNQSSKAANNSTANGSTGNQTQTNSNLTTSNQTNTTTTNAEEEASAQQSMKVFFQAVELYLCRVIKIVDQTISNTYGVFLENYLFLSRIIFAIFLCVQLFTLLILRGHLVSSLKTDIMESRGILNLIPNNFFEQNRALVENLMKRIRE